METPDLANIPPEQVEEVLRSLIRSRIVQDDATEGLHEAIQPYLGDIHNLSQYDSDPLGFAHDILGFKFWWGQEAILKSVVEHRNTVVEKGHGIGGSFSVATIIAWFMSVKPKAKCITLAPTFNQVNHQIWQELRTAFKHSKVPLPGKVLESPVWKIDSEREALGLSPKKATEIDVATLQGYHSPNLLVIIDEAGGITTPLINAAKSLLTSENNRLLMIGNPVAMEGPFFDATKDPSFYHLRFSSLEHPNVIEGWEIIPGAVSRTWVKERIDELCMPCESDTLGAFEFLGFWYQPSGVFEARVLGRPPQEKDDQLIRLQWVYNAEIATLSSSEGGRPAAPRVIGVDVARFGEGDSVMVYRTGPVVRWMRRLHGQDTQKVAGWVIAAMQETGAEHTYIDCIGVGSGVFDTCQRMGYSVVGVYGSRNAIQKKRYANKRSELWWIVREVLRKGDIKLPKDDRLEADLTSPKFGYDLYGRIELEEKEKAIKRLGRSPDAGDALAMTFSAGMPAFDEAEGEMRPEYADLMQRSRWGISKKDRDDNESQSRWIVSRRKGWLWRR